MPTFSTLRTRLRDDVLAESDTSFFSDADLLDFLVQANEEIASMGGFPVVQTTSSLSSGSSGTSFTGAPLSNVEFREVTFDGFQLEPADDRTISLYRSIGGLTRYYHFSPRGPGGTTVSIAPAAHKSGTLTINYVKDLTSESYSASDSPWDGLMDDWHDCIVYLAGVKAFERSGEYDRAQYWMQRLQRRLEPLAIYLDNNNVLNVVTSVNPEGAQ